MSSKLKFVSVMLLAAALAGCGSTGSGGVSPGNGGGDNGGGSNGGNGDGNGNGGGNGGSNGGGNGGDDNGGDLTEYQFRGHFIRSNRNDLSDTEVETGTMTARLAADRSSASVDVSADGLDIPGAADLPLTETDGGFEGFGEEDDTFLSIYSGSDSLIAGENYQMGFYGNQDATNIHGGVGIAGNPTPASQITASGTYSGAAAGYARTYYDPDVYGWGGTATIGLDVNGDQAHVEGVIDNVYVEDMEFVPAYISLERAAVVDGAYEGDVQLRFLGTGAALPTNEGSNYQGAFYGDDAAETAGTFHASGAITLPTGQASDIEMIGGFGASRD